MDPKPCEVCDKCLIDTEFYIAIPISIDRTYVLCSDCCCDCLNEMIDRNLDKARSFICDFAQGTLDQ